jgi:hypothetical protein
VQRGFLVVHRDAAESEEDAAAARKATLQTPPQNHRPGRGVETVEHFEELGSLGVARAPYELGLRFWIKSVEEFDDVSRGA